VSKYALVERERRFLVENLPAGLGPGYAIEDRYLCDVRLRLRRMEGPEGAQFKLTQKIPRGPSDNLITTIYLTEPEYLQLRALPGDDLRKTRHRFLYQSTLWAIDVFAGLVLAETELSEEEDVALPPFLGREVTADARYDGGNLARLGPP
jgi:CYTH domain-containing protein